MGEIIRTKKRQEINNKYKWKTEKLYVSDDVWEEDFLTLSKISGEILKFKGTLGEKEELLKFFKMKEKIERLNEKLYLYSHLRNDEDTQNGKYQGMKSKISALTAEISSYFSFYTPEIINLEEDVFKEIYNSESMKGYKFLLECIRNEKEHTLSEDKEEILALLSDTLEAPSNIFNMLTFADMTFGNIKNEDGNEVEITNSNYYNYIKSEKRDIRAEAFKIMHNNYKKYENTYATTLTTGIKTFALESKLRNYSSSLEASLKPNDIPLSVYKNTIEVVNENIEVLHRYVSLKKKLLGLEDIHMYDLYTPIIKTPKINISFEEGVAIIKRALKPLGEEYIKILDKGINEGWIDVFENQGKKGGAYSSGSYDSMPYILLNYNNDVNSISTLAHEMGHSIHTYLSNMNQPYIYSNYTLFCAEVASTTNENLLINYLIENEKDSNMRLYLINQEIENIRTTLFRQVMFAEFELFTHESIEKGETLTANELNNFYYNLNKKYFGEEIIIDKEIEIEWARIPHFYRDFYVYQYATGYSAAYNFSNSILKGEENSLLKYFNFLKSGGSDHPINILNNSGVDMRKKEPMENTIKRFDELIKMLSGEK